jgi:hypothetical protein
VLGSGWGAEHVIVMVKEIESVRNMFASLGFTATPPGTVSKVLLHSLVRFENGTYLELTQFLDDPKKFKKEATTGHQLFLQRYAAAVLRREGGKHVGISVKPASDTSSFLRSRGFEVTDPIGDSNAWEQEHSPTPEWWTVDFTRPSGITEWLSFLEYSHHDEMLKMQRENAAKGEKKVIEDHFNTAVGIRQIWIAVRDLEAQAKLLEKVGFTRAEEVEKTHLAAQGLRFESGRASLVLLAPTKAPEGLLGAWMKKNGEGVYGVRIEVQDIRRALVLIRERFPGKQVVLGGHGADGGRGFVVSGEFAGGMQLELWMKN